MKGSPMGSYKSFIMWIERLVLCLWSSMLMELSDPDLKMTKGAKIDMFFPALLQKKSIESNRK